MKNQDYRLKYQDLKLKFNDAVDMAFRLGFEAGAQGAQLRQSQQDQANNMAQDQADASGQHQGMEQMGTDGSELDQHIGTLEGMLGQAKPGSIEQAGLKKSLDGLKAFQSNLKQQYEFQKSEQAVSAIEKALKPKMVIGKGAHKNLPEHSKKALTSQEQLVADIMKAMDEEEAVAKSSIVKTLNLESLLKD